MVVVVAVVVMVVSGELWWWWSIVASKVSLDVVMPAVAWHKWSAELLKLSGDAHALNATRPAGIPAPGAKNRRTKLNRAGGVCQWVGVGSSVFFF